MNNNYPKQLPMLELKNVCGFDDGIYFFDERVRQIRSITDPFDYYDLNDFELFFFKEKSEGASPPILVSDKVSDSISDGLMEVQL